MGGIVILASWKDHFIRVGKNMVENIQVTKYILIHLIDKETNEGF